MENPLSGDIVDPPDPAALRRLFFQICPSIMLQITVQTIVGPTSLAAAAASV
jgi:hypothetical protein